ncbi:unnamed protein product, partial [Polarella glacialis]
MAAPTARSVSLPRLEADGLPSVDFAIASPDLSSSPEEGTRRGRRSLRGAAAARDTATSAPPPGNKMRGAPGSPPPLTGFGAAASSAVLRGIASPSRRGRRSSASPPPRAVAAEADFTGELGNLSPLAAGSTAELTGVTGHVMPRQAPPLPPMPSHSQATLLDPSQLDGETPSPSEREDPGSVLLEHLRRDPASEASAVSSEEPPVYTEEDAQQWSDRQQRQPWQQASGRRMVEQISQPRFAYPGIPQPRLQPPAPPYRVGPYGPGGMRPVVPPLDMRYVRQYHDGGLSEASASQGGGWPDGHYSLHLGGRPFSGVPPLQEQHRASPMFPPHSSGLRPFHGAGAMMPGSFRPPLPHPAAFAFGAAAFAGGAAGGAARARLPRDSAPPAWLPGGYAAPMPMPMAPGAMPGGSSGPMPRPPPPPPAFAPGTAPAPAGTGLQLSPMRLRNHFHLDAEDAAAEASAPAAGARAASGARTPANRRASFADTEYFSCG